MYSYVCRILKNNHSVAYFIVYNKNVEDRRKGCMGNKIVEQSGKKKNIKGVGKQKAKIINMAKILKISEIPNSIIIQSLIGQR